MPTMKTAKTVSESAGQPFVKMHGLGNDFVVIDVRDSDLAPNADYCRAIAHRRTGVGCDQILLVTLADSDCCAWGYRVINADGSEVEQCGNGVRCVARWLYDRQELDRVAWLDSAAGPVQIRMEDDGDVTVDMGEPEFAPQEIPFDATTPALDYSRQVGGEQVRFAALSMGNPHAVLLVDDVDTAPVSRLAPAIQAEGGFPAGVNVGFLQPLDRARLALRVFERGVGETRACGTGACAAAVAAHRWGLVGDTAEVRLPGGTLQIQWSGEGHRVMMRGPASYAFAGSLMLT